jgi:hypothetical protein
MITKSSIIILFTAVLTTSAFAVPHEKADSAEALYVLITLAQDIIFGKNTDTALISIAEGASAVSSSRIADLRAVLSEQDTSVRLREDSTRQAIQVRLKTNETEDAGYLVLTTSGAQGKDKRYHMIVFMKNKEHKWLIETWRTPE